jgi:protein TonB
MQRILTISVILLSYYSSFAQDTTYYNIGQKVVENIDQAAYYEIKAPLKNFHNDFFYYQYYTTGQLKSSVRKLNDKAIGKWQHWSEDGRLQKSVEYWNGLYHGQFITYWSNGNPKRIDNFNEGTLIDGKCFTVDGQETTYFDYHVQPSFVGDMPALNKFLLMNLKYPHKARSRKIQGQVFTEFYVEVDGSLTNIKTVEEDKNDPDLQKEALRVIKLMPRWNPGLYEGEPIRTRFVLPIRFKLG